MFIVDWDDLGKNVVSEVHVKRFKVKENWTTKVQVSLMCSCADCSCRQEDHVHLVLRRRQKTVGVSDAVEGANRRRLLWLRENLTRDTTDGNVFL